MSTTVDTLFKHVQHYFTNNKWSSTQTPTKVSFNSKVTPYDEYVIETPTSTEITVSIPLDKVAYKKTFSLRNETLHSIINYVKMHLDLYEQGNP